MINPYNWGTYTGFGSDYDVKNKDLNIIDMIHQLLNRSLMMFQYTNLPDSIPAEILERYLQTQGFVGIIEHEGNLVCQIGSMSGEPDIYNRPTEFHVVNPHISKKFKVEDIVLIHNDIQRQGLLPIYKKYATHLIENELTMIQANINKRILNIITAADSNTKESAEKYLKKIEDGETGVIMDNKLYESLKVHSNAGVGVNMIDLVQYQQYLKASLFNEIGLNANYNMKKERLISGEIEANADVLYPLIDNMLFCRNQGLEAVNKKYGLNIGVELNSSWDYRNDDSIESPDEDLKKSEKKVENPDQKEKKVGLQDTDKYREDENEDERGE